MNVMKKLTPGTTVFVTADHGFGPVGRERIYFKDYDLNENEDCSYLNCRLKVAWANVDLPEPLRKKVIHFTPQELRMTVTQTWTKKNGQVRRTYACLSRRPGPRKTARLSPRSTKPWYSRGTDAPLADPST